MYERILNRLIGNTNAIIDYLNIKSLVQDRSSSNRKGKSSDKPKWVLKTSKVFEEESKNIAQQNR
eukprot:UN06355